MKALMFIWILCSTWPNGSIKVRAYTTAEACVDASQMMLNQAGDRANTATCSKVPLETTP